MKKFLVMFLLALAGLMSVAMAKVEIPYSEESQVKVMPIIWVSPEGISNVTEAEEILYSGIEKALATQRVTLVDQEEAQSIFREYLMENDRTPDSFQDVHGYLPKKKELQDMAELSGADYVMVINARATDKKAKVAWLAFSPVKYEVTVMFTTLIYSVKDGKYVYNKQVSVKENAAGSSSYERAFKKACMKFINKELALPTLALGVSKVRM